MKPYRMYKGTWFFLVLFCAALLLGGPAHSLFEDHGGEVVTHCDGHTPLEHLEGAEGDHDILPCDLCLTLSDKAGLLSSQFVTRLPQQAEISLLFEEDFTFPGDFSLPLLRAPPFVIL